MYQPRNDLQNLIHLQLAKQAPSNGYCKLTNPPRMEEGCTNPKTNSNWSNHKDSRPGTKETPREISITRSSRQLFHIHYNLPPQKRYPLTFVIRSWSSQYPQLSICSRLSTLQIISMQKMHVIFYIKGTISCNLMDIQNHRVFVDMKCRMQENHQQLAISGGVDVIKAKTI